MIAQIDVTDIRIETPRLILRPWREADLQDFFEYAKVDGVGQMAGWKPHTSIEESAAILRMFISEKKTLALELKESNRVIGSLGMEAREDILTLPENWQGRELGYVLAKPYWGRGLMPEAVLAVMDYLFSQLSYDYISCGHFVRNEQSRRVIEKCGFQYVRTFDYTTRMGTIEPTSIYICYHPEKRGSYV